MDKPTKPFIITFAEAKSAINSAINTAIHQHNIPCTLLESVLAEALLKVKEGARSEKEAAIRSYEKQIAEEEAGGEDNGS